LQAPIDPCVRACGPSRELRAYGNGMPLKSSLVDEAARLAASVAVVAYSHLAG